ncbi:hypothetical protein [Nocardia vaccinii]|uniref:hypothetical protein n=1 Tax=Nocardia vaccinii TaxID=1822 RepID=UPI000AF1C912|nr:hypothetical protein [Nocardia vaccinii]
MLPTSSSISAMSHDPARWVRRCVLLILGVGVLIWAGGSAPGWAVPVTTPPSPPSVTTPITPGPPTPAPVTPATPTTPTTAPTTPGPVPGEPCPDTSQGCTSQPGQDRGPAAAPEPDCGLDAISGCLINAMDGLLSTVVSSALDPLLQLLSTTLLATPDPASLPRVGQLWTSSWQITLTVYGLLVMAAGLLVMSYETLQSRWSLREVAPGLVIGMVAAGLSFPLVTQAVRAANALSAAVAGGGVDPDSAGQALRQLASATIGTGGIFGLLLAIVLVVLVVMLLAGYVIRVAITIVLIVAAPLALMCHAVPVTEPIARWWWRSMGACLAIQVVQSLTLITATRVFLTSGDWHLLGASQSGLVDLIVSIALVGVLVKIPFWMLSAMRIGSGHSMAGRIVRSYLTYKTLGLLRGSGGKSSKPRPKPARAEPDPYDKAETAPDGQMMLPLQGLKRVRPKPPPPAPAQRAPRSADSGQQLTLDLDKPSLPLPPEAPRPEGQRALFYATPIKPTHRRPTSANTSSAGSGRAGASTGKRAPKGRQLTLRFPPPQPPKTPPARVQDPYARPTSTTQGQYVLPLEVKRVRKPAPPPTPAWIAPPAPRRAGRQLHLPLPDLPVRRRRRPDPGGTR